MRTCANLDDKSRKEFKKCLNFVDLQTALLQAVNVGNVAMIRTLLEMGAKVDLEIYDTAPLPDGDKYIVNLLIEYEKNPLIRAILKDDLAGVKQALEFGVNIESKFGRFTACELALYRTHEPKIVDLLLERGAKLDKLAILSLFTECDVDYPDVLEVLIKHKFDVSLPDKTGQTPLMNCRSSKCTKLLLDAKADVSALDQKTLSAILSSQD